MELCVIHLLPPILPFRYLRFCIYWLPQCFTAELVSWCFKLSQPQRIVSGLRETFIKRCIVERQKRPEEQSEKAESCRENLWNEIQLKGS